MENISFALDIQDGWPPVAAESLWCERTQGRFKLQSIPLFVRGLAWGDVIAATPDAHTGQVADYELVEASGHSVIWMLNPGKLEIDEFIAELQALGCKVVSGLLGYEHYAIDVPPGADIGALDGMISLWDELGLAFAYAAWRHDD